MYKEYFGLKESPFSIAPDPHYLYMSDNHREALAHLLYGINSDNGFVLLTGDVGTGKTTVCRCLLAQLPENSNIAFILNPKVTVDELLATICDELGVGYPPGNISNKVFIDSINDYLINADNNGRRTVLIVEEAQNLRPEVLEQIRLLTNLETNERKLLQIIMVGQPELNELLSRSELKQLKQRITARYHLGPLTKQELSAYVLHRLSVAGVNRKLFPSRTIERLFQLSGGIPRIVNLLCDRTLLGTYVQGKSMVDLHTLNKASCEVFGDPGERRQRKKTFSWAIIGLLLIICGTALAATYFSHKSKLFEGNKTGTLQMNISQRPADKPWPADLPLDRDKTLAFQVLFRQWEIPYKNNVDVCQQAEAQGLRCMEDLGTLTSIMKLNSPALLKLYDEKGKEFFVTLAMIKGRLGTIEVGDERRTVDLKEIEHRWLGDYTLLWRVPSGYRGDIHPGMAGPDVHWLDMQLAVIQGRKARTEKNLTYDAQLTTEVKKFQISEEMVPDGIVGPRTIIHLNTAAGIKGPRLVQRQGET